MSHRPSPLAKEFGRSASVTLLGRCPTVTSVTHRSCQTRLAAAARRAPELADGVAAPGEGDVLGDEAALLVAPALLAVDVGVADGVRVPVGVTVGVGVRVGVAVGAARTVVSALALLFVPGWSDGLTESIDTTLWMLLPAAALGATWTTSVNVPLLPAE